MIRTIILMLTIGISLFSACNFVSPTQARPPSPGPANASAEYAYAWQFLDVYFIFRDSLPEDPYAYASPQALYQSVQEPYTVYLTKPEAAAFMQLLTTRSEDGRIGIIIDSVARGFAIKEVFPGSPGARAGLLEGDTIISADSVLLAGISYAAAREYLGGPVGQPRVLGIARSSGDTTITVILDVFYAPSVLSDTLDSVSALIQLTGFFDSTVHPAGSAGEMDSALVQCSWAPYLVIDLRGNPGGELRQCLTITSRFVPAQTPVVRSQERTYNGLTNSGFTRSTIWETDSAGLFTSQKLYVLVDHGTASAAEILVACLRDFRANVTIIGKTTYGKGRGQVLGRTPDSGLVKVTYALLTPVNGAPYDQVGIVPDIVSDSPDSALVVAQQLIAQDYGSVAPLAKRAQQARRAHTLSRRMDQLRMGRAWTPLAIKRP